MSREMRKQYSDPLGSYLEKPGIGSMFASGVTVPTDTSTGYAPGCLFVHEDGSADGVLYVNQGTQASSNFDALIPAAGSPSFATVSVENLAFPAAGDIDVAANTAVALEVDDGTTKILAIDTRNTIADVSNWLFRGAPPTIATAAAAHLNPTVQIAAKTITYTGTATVTSSLGAGLHVGAHTFTDAGAGTITTVSAVHIVANAAAGGSLTITNSRMISTSVSDCYLTNAGVWTDTACWESGKEFVNRAYSEAADAVGRVLEKITPATWKYKAVTELPSIEEDGSAGVHRTAVNDRGRERVGIVYDDLPDELRAPGEERGVSAGVLASFALAALKTMYDRNQALEARLAALEAR